MIEDCALQLILLNTFHRAIKVLKGEEVREDIQIDVAIVVENCCQESYLYKSSSLYLCNLPIAVLDP